MTPDRLRISLTFSALIPYSARSFDLARLNSVAPFVLDGADDSQNRSGSWNVRWKR
jgi:hypothetical protein